MMEIDQERRQDMQPAHGAALHVHYMLPTPWICMAICIAVITVAAAETAIHVGNDGVLYIGDEGTDARVRIAGVDINNLQQQMDLMKQQMSLMNRKLDRTDKLTWQTVKFEYKLAAVDPAVGDLFGSSLAGNGDLLFVGTSRDDNNAPDSGSVCAFEKNRISHRFHPKYKLTTTNAAADDYFGSSVCVAVYWCTW